MFNMNANIISNVSGFNSWQKDLCLADVERLNPIIFVTAFFSNTDLILSK